MKDNTFLAAIVVAVIGVAASFGLCTFILGEMKEVQFNTVDAKVNSALVEPDQEVFNYRALNPTVEVCVGECATDGVYENNANKAENQETQ